MKTMGGPVLDTCWSDVSQDAVKNARSILIAQCSLYAGRQQSVHGVVRQAGEVLGPGQRPGAAGRPARRRRQHVPLGEEQQ